MITSPRYHPYPSFVYEGQLRQPGTVSQDQFVPQTQANDSDNQTIPNQSFGNFRQPPTDWYGNYLSNFPFGLDNLQYEPATQPFPYHPEFSFPPYMNQWLAPYPMMFPAGPPPPTIENSPILSTLLSSPDSVRSHPEYVHSVTSSKVGTVPSVEDPPVVEIRDEDPIGEAMAAWIYPGIVSDINEEARTPKNSPSKVNHQVTLSPDLSVDSATSTVVDRKEKCPVCNKLTEFLEKHLFDHMLSLIHGFVTKANKHLILWIKHHYPVVLERTVYCQICKSDIDGIFTRANVMWSHIEQLHGIRVEMFDNCFPRWSPQELTKFGFTDQMETADQPMNGSPVSSSSSEKLQTSLNNSSTFVISKCDNICPVCNRSVTFLKTHMRKHMEAVSDGKEKLNHNLAIWIKQNYPIALQRKTLCQLCGFRCYSGITMTHHASQSHIIGVFSESNFIAELKQQLNQMMDQCFPRFEFQNDITLADENAIKVYAAPLEYFCPVCSKCHEGHQKFDNQQLENHIGQHLFAIIAGSEPPNQNLTSWLKRCAPVSLERNIFCRICQSACFHLSAHAKEHGLPIDLCFPKWTYEQLFKLGFITQTSSQPKVILQQTSYVVAEETTQSELPKSDFDLLDSLERMLVKKEDIDFDRQSIPSPGQLMIDENYSAELAIEVIVDNDSSARNSIQEIVDNDSFDGNVMKEIIDKDLSDRNSIIDIIDNDLSDRNSIQDIIDKDLSDRNSIQDIIDKDLSDRNSIQDIIDKDLSDRNSIQDIIDKDLSDRNSIQDIIDKDLSDRNSIQDIIDNDLSDRNSIQDIIDKDLSDRNSIQDIIDKDLSDRNSIQDIIDNDLSDRNSIQDIIDNDLSDRNSIQDIIDKDLSDRNFIQDIVDNDSSGKSYTDDIVDNDTSDSILVDSHNTAMDVQVMASHSVVESTKTNFSVDNADTTMDFYSSSPAEQSNFNTIVISPTLAHWSVDGCLKSDNDIVSLLKADEIEAAMAKLSFRKNAYHELSGDF